MGTRQSRTASVGTAPEITLATADGKSWRLAEQLAEGPVVLVFLRGFF